MKLMVSFQSKQSCVEESTDENTSHQRLEEDNDDEHAGDMPLRKRGQHGGSTFSQAHEGQVTEGLRWTTR